MNLLTIDLGDTTGIAWFEDDKFTAAKSLELVRVLPYLKNNFLKGEIDKVVLEAPAMVQIGHHARDYADVVAKLSIRFGKKLTTIRPTDWKQRYGDYPLPGRGVLKTKHERDAYRIGAWFLKLVV